jgi:predicted AAA+ superfamily ATPase
MMGYKRHLERKIRHLLTLFPAVAIVGVRQCGKTTLSREIGKGWRYMDLENDRDFSQISTDPTFFFDQYPAHIILDEAQEYSLIFKTLRGVIDRDRASKGRFIITGSSQPELIYHISESLAGRLASVCLSPLKTSEYLNRELSPFYTLFERPLSKKNSVNWTVHPHQDFHTLWLKGGFPEPLSVPKLHRQWMNQFYDHYVYRDIGRLFKRLDSLKFRRFVRLLGTLSGTLINKSDVARQVECNESTIRDYLDIAHGTFMWRMIPSYENSQGKSLVKMPKGYLRDSGMLHDLLGIETMDQLLGHPIVGRSFESFVIEEILRGIDATTATHVSPYYYRTRDGAEIDLILEGSFGTLPIEIKHGSTLRPSDTAVLRKFVQDYHLEFGIVITQNPEVYWVSPEVLHVPLGCL